MALKVAMATALTLKHNNGGLHQNRAVIDEFVDTFNTFANKQSASSFFDTQAGEGFKSMSHAKGVFEQVIEGDIFTTDDKTAEFCKIAENTARDGAWRPALDQAFALEDANVLDRDGAGGRMTGIGISVEKLAALVDQHIGQSVAGVNVAAIGQFERATGARAELHASALVLAAGRVFARSLAAKDRVAVK